MRYILIKTSTNDALSSLLIDHYILSDGVTAYHNTRSGDVTIEPLDDATEKQGRKVLCWWVFESDRDLKAYAESLVGRKFDFVNFNCEHFVRGFIGSDEILFGSTQVNNYAMSLLGGLLFGM